MLHNGCTNLSSYQLVVSASLCSYEPLLVFDGFEKKKNIDIGERENVS